MNYKNYNNMNKKRFFIATKTWKTRTNNCSNLNIYRLLSLINKMLHMAKNKYLTR